MNRRGGLIALLVAVLLIVPKPFPLPRLCVWWHRTETPCVSCGLTRATRELAQWQFVEALRHNPAVFVVWALLAWMGLTLLIRPRVRLRFTWPTLILIAAVAGITWYLKLFIIDRAYW